MKRQLVSVLGLVVVVLALSGEASALVQRTFVSGLGLDTNPCTRTEPCRTFATAIAQTLPGGEVLALDTAGYGPFTITQSVSIIAPPGVYAGITTTTPGANGITISAGASDVVVLKGLSVTGLGIGDVGIAFNSAKTLRVEGLTITGFGNGIEFDVAATARLAVTDSTLRENASNGLYAQAAPGQVARVTVDRTRLMGNFNALSAGPRTRMTARDTVTAGNTQFGFSNQDASSVLTLENCLSTDNGVGIFSSGVTRVAGSTVTDNTTGLSGTLFSRGNTTVEGNGTDGTFTSTFSPK
jgi:copper-binding protein NosD